MSGSRPTVGIRISSEGGEKARRDIEALGPAGEAAMRRVAAASAAATPEMQRLAAASDVANRAFVGMGGSLGRVGSVFTGVSGVTAGVTAGFTAMAAAAAMSAVAIAKAGDAATATLARLNSATGSMQSAQAVYQKLFELSQQTGVAVSESAGAFTRFSVAAKEIGGTTDQVLKLVAGIQKAGIVSGSSTQETGAAVQQLGQALASGVLQGDELRSLLENMPIFAQALARELGVGIGQLRQMGSEGKLTADTIFPAILRASEQMNAEFDKMAPTMGRAFAILGEGMVDFASKLDKALGLSEAIARAAMAAASAVRGVSAAAFPSDRDQIVSARDAAASRAAQIRTQISGAGDIRSLGIGQLASPQDRTIDVSALRSQLAAAESEMRGHNDRLAEIDKEGAQARWGEQVTAQQRAAQSARESAQRAYDAKRTDWDKDFKLREDARKKIEVIETAEKTGAISSMEATRDRARVNEELSEALEKLAKSTDAVSTATRGAGRAAKDADQQVQDFWKAQQRAADEAAKAQEKATQAQAKYVEASRDALLNIPERALDRLGDSLVDAFVRGEGAAVNFGNIMRSVIASAVADITKLGLINPLMNSVFTSSSGARPTLAGAFGGSSTSTGLGDALGLGQLLGGKGLGESLGLTGSSGILSTPLWSTGGGYSFTAGGGLVAPGSVSLGGLLGGAGAGFGAGMLLNGMLGGNSTGGTVGSGVGGLAGAAIGSLFPGVGTLLGGLIGGGLGGGLGGLIGPGESVKGYGYRLQPGENGMLSMGSTFYNESGKAAFDEAAAGIAQLNQYLGARGITVGGSVAVGGNKDGPDYSNASAGTFAEGVSQLYYRSNNAQLDYAIANQRGRQFGSSAEMQTFVEGFYQASDALTALTAKPIPAFIQQLSAVNDNFGAAIAKANEYGLAVGEVTAAQQDAVAKLFEARAEQLRQSDIGLDIREMTAKGDTQGAELARQAESARQELANFGKALEDLGLTTEERAAKLVRLEQVQAAERMAVVEKFGKDATTALQTALGTNSLLRELTYGASSALAPSQKYFAAMTDLNSAKSALDAGGSLADYTNVASAVLPVARDFLGTSTRYGTLAAEIGGVIASKGGDPANLAAIMSANVDMSAGLQATFAAYGDQQIMIATNTLGEMKRLSSLIEAFITRKAA